jgi:hypothetical protein
LGNNIEKKTLLETKYKTSKILLVCMLSPGWVLLFAITVEGGPRK